MNLEQAKEILKNYTDPKSTTISTRGYLEIKNYNGDVKIISNFTADELEAMAVYMREVK